MTNLVIMESITKKCSKCKKMLCVEIFGDNGKGECFKTCDACREKDRAQKLKNKKKQGEEENLVLDNSNKNEFVRRVSPMLRHKPLFLILTLKSQKMVIVLLFRIIHIVKYQLNTVLFGEILRRRWRMISA